MAGCGIHQVKAALWSQRGLIETEIREERVEQKKFFLNKIKMGKEVDFHENSDTVIFRKGLAQAVGYSQIVDPFPDTCDGPALELGQLPGISGVQDSCGADMITTMINPTEENLCDGVKIVDYGQGFDLRSSENVEVKIGTEERCIKTLAKKERKHVREYIMEEKKFLVETAYLSKDRALANLTVKNSGANSVVRDVTLQPEPELTANGWNLGSDPNGFTDRKLEVKHVTIYYLQRYRQRIVDLLESAAVPNATNFVLEVPLTRDAWRFALAFESINMSSDKGLAYELKEALRLNRKIDEKALPNESSLKGRNYDTYGMIRIVFEEEPMRMIAVQSGNATDGTPIFSVLRVHKWVSEKAEGGGIGTIKNPDYERNFVTLKGLRYPILEAICNIHDDSFEIRPLSQGEAPDGVNPLNNDFSVQLLTGGDLGSSDCPNFGGFKYRYYMENAFRWINHRNEFSGVILHRRYNMVGYNADIDVIDLTINDGVSNSNFLECDAHDEQKCNPECDPTDCTDPSTNTVTMVPCGSEAQRVVWYGDKTQIQICVSRDRDCSDLLAKVQYGLVDGTALAGTHYQHVDENGSSLGVVGELEWQPGEYGERCILIDIIGALPDTALSSTDCCDDDDNLSANIADFNIKLTGAIGTNLGDCFEAKVGIENFV